MSDNDIKNRVLGCLVGGAVGDALGYPVEFMTYSQIQRRYGSKGITRYDYSDKGTAEISDDTQMTLYTANGLLIDDVQQAYLEWYNTQTRPFGLQSGAKCWISKLPALYSLRAPGNTCMSALQNLMDGHPVHNSSKGCGGIMRVAPIALWGYTHNHTIEQVAADACYAARLTHQHPLGFLSAGLMVAVLYQILASDQRLSSDTLFDYVLHGIYVLSNIKDAEGTPYKSLYTGDLAELHKGSTNAMKAAKSDKDDATNIERLGQGWTGEEAWYISLYCTLRHIDSFEDAVVAAVNHDGDSDSTGAITGNLMGALLGYDAIPEYYKVHLELRDTIEKIASQLSFT